MFEHLRRAQIIFAATGGPDGRSEEEIEEYSHKIKAQIEKFNKEAYICRDGY